LPEAVDACLDRRVTVPMAGRTDSLNVGMAAAVLCFEVARQRRTP
jgi:tRNA G18 (ribose-2'-O)-methylase SpoU